MSYYSLVQCIQSIRVSTASCQPWHLEHPEAASRDIPGQGDLQGRGTAVSNGEGTLVLLIGSRECHSALSASEERDRGQ